MLYKHICCTKLVYNDWTPSLSHFLHYPLQH